MKLLYFSLALAFVATGQGMSTSRLDMKSVLYTIGGTVQCDMCEMIVGDVQTILEGREPQIQSLLDSLCADLPTQYQSNCTYLVDTYLPIIFSLVDDMTPAEVCELLTLCSGELEYPELQKSVTSFVNVFVKRISGIRSLRNRRIGYIRRLAGENYLCEACEDTIGFVHDAVACNYTWEEVANFLGPLCEVCPQRASCENFFRELPADVNDFANKYLDPIQDCEILGFCPAEDEEFETDPTPENEPTTEPEVEPEVPVEPTRPRVNINVNGKTYNMRHLKKLDRKFGKGMEKHGRRGMDVWRRRMTRSIVVSVAGQETDRVPYEVTEEKVPTQKKCEVCRYFSSAAEGVLEYNEEDITNGLTIVFGDICNALPDEWKTECNTELKDVAPAVIYQAALKAFDPEYLCTELICICTSNYPHF